MSDEELDSTIDIEYCYYDAYEDPVETWEEVRVLSLNENDKGKRFLSMRLYFEDDEL
jgi:hypothetical protein